MQSEDRQTTVLTQKLAELYGLETRYRDTHGLWREATVGALMTVLRALGADLPPEMGPAPALEHALDTRTREMNAGLVEPVLLAWDGRAEALTLRSGDPDGGGGDGRPTRDRTRLTLTLEDGTVSDVEVDAAFYAVRSSGDPVPLGACIVPPEIWTGRMARGARSSGARPSSAHLPLGYHRLVVEKADRVEEALVISAPKRCFSAADGLPPAAWGVFAPLYALRSGRDWGAGDLTELEDVLHAVGASGGCAVATLPLLASYLDVPFEPAPYRPVSRLLWNEFYLAPERTPGFGECAAALQLWESGGLQKRISALRDGRYVDYRETMALKRAVLEELAAAFFASGREATEPSYRRFLEIQKEAPRYADFREQVERRAGERRSWGGERSASRGAPARPAGGRPAKGRISARQYHLYCQWRMEEEMSSLARAEASTGLLLDLPVGTHPGGYDTWRWQGQFVPGLSTGAPPDSFFSRGQDWAFPPLHPDEARRSGHEYFAACLRHHMRHASVLRVDHIMGLHRLYVIPAGEPAAEGVYLRYPAEELYALLTLESQRSGTVVVGEDLGTVPDGVRATMRRRGVMRTWVLQSSVRPRAAVPVTDIPSSSVGSLNTHDMFPWAGFLEGRDIEARLETGQVAADEAARETESRAALRMRLADFLLPLALGGPARAGHAGQGPGADSRSSPETLLRGALAYLRRRSDGLVMLNIEDLLLETEPQNLPGTGAERPNWRRRVPVGMESVLRSIARAGRWLSR